MHRFYVPSQNISGKRIIMREKGQVHHIKDVLRLEANDELAAFDENGNEYACSVKELQEDKIILEIKNKRKPKKQALKIAVACALPKKSKFEDIVDKLTQLGVDKIIPLKTERVIVKLDKQKERMRLVRWKKIAQSASQQSKRNTLPIIEPVKTMEEALLESRDYDLKLIPTLLGKRKSLKEIFSDTRAKKFLILIGPEGDFSQDEVNMALEAGFIPVTLGDLVLRVDTAAIAAVSFIRFIFGAPEHQCTRAPERKV